MAQIFTTANGINNDTEMKTIDANRYATKKTIAQGMLDIALLTANASQLKYILGVGEQHQFYKLMLILISLSIVLQILSGILSLSLSLMRDCRMHQPEFHQSANILNHIRTAFAFFTTMINLFISAFDSRLPPPSQENLPKDILVGILFVVIGSLNINKIREQSAAIILNDVILAMVFLISVINVIISGFGIEYY